MRHFLIEVSILYLLAIDLIAFNVIRTQGANAVLFAHLVLGFSFFMYILLAIEHMEGKKQESKHAKK